MKLVQVMRQQGHHAPAPLADGSQSSDGNSSSSEMQTDHEDLNRMANNSVSDDCTSETDVSESEANPMDMKLSEVFGDLPTTHQLVNFIQETHLTKRQADTLIQMFERVGVALPFKNTMHMKGMILYF